MVEHLTVECKTWSQEEGKVWNSAPNSSMGASSVQKVQRLSLCSLSYLSSVTSLEVLASTLVVTCRIPKRKSKRIPKPPRHPYLLKLLKATETPGWGWGGCGRSIVSYCLSLFQTQDSHQGHAKLKWEARVVQASLNLWRYWLHISFPWQSNYEQSKLPRSRKLKY